MKIIKIILSLNILLFFCLTSIFSQSNSTVFDYKRLKKKCDCFHDWAKTVNEKYPDLNIMRIPIGGNEWMVFFRDENFISFSGKSFYALSLEDRKRLTEIMKSCDRRYGYITWEGNLSKMIDPKWRIYDRVVKEEKERKERIKRNQDYQIAQIKKKESKKRLYLSKIKELPNQKVSRIKLRKIARLYKAKDFKNLSKIEQKDYGILLEKELEQTIKEITILEKGKVESIIIDLNYFTNSNDWHKHFVDNHSCWEYNMNVYIIFDELFNFFVDKRIEAFTKLEGEIFNQFVNTNSIDTLESLVKEYSYNTYLENIKLDELNKKFKEIALQSFELKSNQSKNYMELLSLLIAIEKTFPNSLDANVSESFLKELDQFLAKKNSIFFSYVRKMEQKKLYSFKESFLIKKEGTNDLVDILKSNNEFKSIAALSEIIELRQSELDIIEQKRIAEMGCLLCHNTKELDCTYCGGDGLRFYRNPATGIQKTQTCNHCNNGKVRCNRCRE